jgi:transglutaminase-like putative cysteine protease
MRYTIRHTTRFIYESPISESVMELRMQPRSDGLQRCAQFTLATNPAARMMLYNDHDGNVVHHFNIPARHSRLTVTASALVECEAPPALPDCLDTDAWQRLDELAADGGHWESIAPSAFTHQTPALRAFADEIGLVRGDDPLVALRRVMTAMRDTLEYRPKTTRVDSPIDDALTARGGVCQDFTHIFLALARSLGIPARYVSGYLFQEHGHDDRSTDGATHAWAEVLLPYCGWVGLDPTNNCPATERHIRVAVGRDYADVPPTRGVFKGSTAVRSELGVVVRIGPVNHSALEDMPPFTPWMSRDVGTPARDAETSTQQMQQQQQ